MTVDEIMSLIQRAVDAALEAKGHPKVVLEPGTDLLDGSVGIDSLDLAGVVVELQNNLGTDPFADGFVEFREAGELARLFHRTP